jgi:L-iditol 2-dehydrogenase
VYKRQGADEVVNVAAGSIGEVKADRIIMCTGAKPAFDGMWDTLDRKGRILLFAIPKDNISVPVENFWRNEFSVVSSYGAAPDDLEESLNLIKSGTVDVAGMITNRFPLDKIGDAWKVAGGGGKTLKVVIESNKPCS